MTDPLNTRHMRDLESTIERRDKRIAELEAGRREHALAFAKFIFTDEVLASLRYDEFLDTLESEE